MHYREFSPSPALQDYIKCFWIMERDFQSLQDGVDLLPDSYCEVIFNFGDSCQIDARQLDGQDVPFVLPACYRVGLFDQPLRLQAHGLLRTIGVRFFAWGFHPLFNSASAEHSLVGDVVYALDESWHHLAGALHTCLQEGDEGAIELLDAYLT